MSEFYVMEVYKLPEKHVLAMYWQGNLQGLTFWQNNGKKSQKMKKSQNKLITGFCGKEQIFELK